jgi:hypothetical protein
MKKLFLILAISLIFSCNRVGQDLSNDGDQGYKYDKVCIEGHVYYSMYTHNGYTVIVLKLDDNGKPVKCGDRK